MNDPFDGTAEIDVKQIGAGDIHDRCGKLHALLIPAIELNAHRALGLEDIQLPAALYPSFYKALAGNELRIRQVSSVGLADNPKRRVADVLHGCQQKRKIRE